MRCTDEWPFFDIFLQRRQIKQYLLKYKKNVSDGDLHMLFKRF